MNVLLQGAVTSQIWNISFFTKKEYLQPYTRCTLKTSEWFPLRQSARLFFVKGLALTPGDPVRDLAKTTCPRQICEAGARKTFECNMSCLHMRGKKWQTTFLLPLKGSQSGGWTVQWQFNGVTKWNSISDNICLTDIYHKKYPLNVVIFIRGCMRAVFM